MIKHLFIIIVIILSAVSVGVWFTGDPGYILIIFHQWQIQTTLVVTLVFILVLSLFLKFGIQIIQTILGLPNLCIRGWEKWQQLRQQKHMTRGLEAYFQGQWQDSLSQLTHTKQNPWNVDLLAAQAAQQQGALNTRDQFILTALTNAPQAKESILLFQAQLQIDEKQYEQAQATLNQLPKHSAQYLWLQLELYHQFNGNEQALQLLKDKRSVLQSNPQYHGFYQLFLKNAISIYLGLDAIDKAIDAYKNAPKALQCDPTILSLLTPALNYYPREQKRLVKQIKKQLNEKFPESLILILNQLSGQNEWIALLEKQAKIHPQNHILFYMLGKMKAQQKIWGSAIIDLQRSIELQPTHEAYTELAKLYLELHQTSNALVTMEKALEIKTTNQTQHALLRSAV